jgi:hypothetical protein
MHWNTLASFCEQVLFWVSEHKPWVILYGVSLAFIGVMGAVGIRTRKSHTPKPIKHDKTRPEPPLTTPVALGTTLPKEDAGQGGLQKGVENLTPPKLDPDQKNYEDVQAAERTDKLEEQKFHLEALKALRDSSFQRWDKRRSYEWQLSISIWTAVAAFCALLLNKDTAIVKGDDVASGVALIGSIIVIAHWLYLDGMFTHTIGDAGVLRWAEREIFKVVIETGRPEITTALDLDEDKIPIHVREVQGRIPQSSKRFLMYPNLSRYGLIQVLITFVLVAAAVACVLRRPQSAPEPNNSHYERVVRLSW